MGNENFKKINKITITLAIILTGLTPQCLTSKDLGYNMNIYTNSQCGIVCVNVSINGSRSKLETIDPMKLLIFDVDGFIVKSAPLVEGTNKVDTEGLTSGVYHIIVYRKDRWQDKNTFIITR